MPTDSGFFGGSYSTADVMMGDRGVVACITQAFCIARAVLQRVVWSCLVERRRALQKAWKHPTGEGPVRPRVARALRALRALSASRVHRGCVLSAF